MNGVSEKTRLGLEILGVGAVLGNAGDQRRRGVPGGIKALLGTAGLVTAGGVPGRGTPGGGGGGEPSQARTPWLGYPGPACHATARRESIPRSLRRSRR